MRKITLGGELGELFGETFELDVNSPAEALHALMIVLPDFKKYLVEHEDDAFAVLAGDVELDENSLLLPTLGDILITPVVGGSGKGFGKILLGAALIGSGMWLGAAIGGGGALAGLSATSIKVLGFAANALGSMGFSMALGGVSSLLFGSQKPDNVTGNPSYAFNGPVNVSRQGSPVPLIYGQLRVGSVVGSAGLSAQEI
jgi:predicted phage tail protein